MSIADWRFDFVLPNLVLPGADSITESPPQPGEWPGGITLGSEFIALVPHQDPRLNAIRTALPEVAKLLDGFRTLAGHKHSPSAIIVREDAPEVLRRDMECLIAFRNAVAFSFILRARAATADGAEPTWSDTFDLHPTIVNQQGRLVTHSDALLALFSTDAAYLATHSAHISPCGWRLYADPYIYRALSEIWKRHYLDRQKSITTTALFRSLEVAFSASSVATRNQGSLSEYGTQMGLWVSALEILAWPKARHANLPSVVKLLDEYSWASETLQGRRFSTNWRGSKIALNPVEYAHVLMYGARNAFLHGNPVSSDTLVPASLSPSLNLPQIASTVYRTALVAHLQQLVPRADLDSGDLSTEMIVDHGYSRVVKANFGLERKN